MVPSKSCGEIFRLLYDSIVYAAGFEPWDVTMSDLLNERITLQDFRGIVFVGGFSYADVLDSAKGWAATIWFNECLLKQVSTFILMN